MTGAECSDGSSMDKIMKCQISKVLQMERNIKDVSDVSGVISSEPKTKQTMCHSDVE